MKLRLVVIPTLYLHILVPEFLQLHLVLLHLISYSVRKVTARHCSKMKDTLTSSSFTEEMNYYYVFPDTNNSKRVLIKLDTPLAFTRVCVPTRSLSTNSFILSLTYFDGARYAKSFQLGNKVIYLFMGSNNHLLNGNFEW